MGEWWRDAVIYQIYPRSFADANGDGVGDLRGITERLDHVADLGVDAVWLSPFYRSPQRDGGYDVSDHRDVDPLFGALADFDALVARVHDLGLRLIVDAVPNHTSTDHEWFVAAVAAGRGSPERERYLFRDGIEDQPPNNWRSLFGGPAWSRVTEPDGSLGQWYLHLFDASQADLDWSQPQVRDDFDAVLRFWWDRGVDGFRIDVADGMVKAPGLPDVDLTLDRYSDRTDLFPMWDQPGVHEILRHWRRLNDMPAGPDLPHDRVLCAEAWVEPPEALARYVRPDELHQSFNFHFLRTDWTRDAVRESIAVTLESAAAVGAPQTWVLSNHDVVRHATRLGADRARAATALMLALPGSAYLYQGEELGLPEVIDLPDDARQDPRWERSGGTDPGRDGCRVPLPWEAEAAAFGFSPSGESWLPQPTTFAALAVDRQRDDPTSTLALYRRLLRLRREHQLGRRELRWVDGGDDVLAFDLLGPTDTIRVITSFGSTPAGRPEGELLVTSDGNEIDESLRPGITAWFRRV